MLLNVNVSIIVASDTDDSYLDIAFVGSPDRVAGAALLMATIVRYTALRS